MTQDLFAGLAGGPGLDDRLTWYCEPERWTFDLARSCLRLEPDAPTDFWQRTHYGFRADTGHFLFMEEAGDFSLRARVEFRPRHQYDQAGLMVRVSSECWLKASVEFEPDGPSRLGAVVTNHGYSDWSTQDFRDGRSAVELRVRRTGADYLVEALMGEAGWTQLRLAHLHEQNPGGRVACGVYACSPKGPGFVAEFSRLILESEG
jgi:uncharacterized protein